MTDDEKYDIQEGVSGDELQFGVNEEDYTHYSNLVIRDLTLMDNETQYYCIVQVGVNNTFDQSFVLYLELLHQRILPYYWKVCMHLYILACMISLFLFICKTCI